MTTNPYQAPDAGPDRSPFSGGGAGEPGRIDISRALKEGWELMTQNVILWLGVIVVAALVTMVSAAALFVPFLVVGPAIFWGYTRFQLDCYEGRGEFGALWSGFSDLGGTLVKMWVFILFSLAVGMLSNGLQLAGDFADSALISFVGGIAAVAINLLALRWSFAPWYIVDQGMGGIDAVKASWKATEGQWLTVVLLALAMGAVVLVGVLALLVGVIPAAALVGFAQTSAYRQLVGPAHQVSG